MAVRGYSHLAYRMARHCFYPLGVRTAILL